MVEVLRRVIPLACAVCLLATVSGCRSEAERRARRIEGLRRDAINGLDALNRYCAARDTAVQAFERQEPGWEPALEELLRGTPALDDYCEEGRGLHEHEEPAKQPPGDTVSRS